MDPGPAATYNVLHNVVEGEDVEPMPGADAVPFEEEVYEDDDDDQDNHHNHHQKLHSKELYESFDFNDCESMMWRKVRFSLFCSLFRA